MILIRYGPKLGEGKVKLILLTSSDYEKFNELRQNGKAQIDTWNGGIVERWNNGKKTGEGRRRGNHRINVFTLPRDVRNGEGVLLVTLCNKTPLSTFNADFNLYLQFGQSTAIGSNRNRCNISIRGFVRKEVV